jgi:hypothetical protein
MTPRLLGKIRDLLEAGATVIGSPPAKSPSLVDYPRCDEQVKQLAGELWGSDKPIAERRFGKGRLIYDPGMSQSPPPDPLAQAKWIWYPEGNPAASAPVGKRYFRRAIKTDEARTIESAEVAMTADNRFELFVNGCWAGAGDDFHVAQTMDVTGLLRPGFNVLTVTAENGGDRPNPAGLIGALTIRFVDGGTMIVNTDRQWTSSLTADGPWSASAELGPVGMPPWNLSSPPTWTRDIYPDYGMTAKVLSQMGVPPDFEADGVRYIHRREPGADLYFIANREGQTRTTTCRFRVAGLQPEWWNPVSGECCDLPEHEEKDGRTAVPVRLEAFESGFVVFRKPAVKRSAPEKNFPELKTIATLSAPWEVEFDPKWGGPAKVVMANLEDWSKRPEPGIKYYSGKALYRTTFSTGGAALHDPKARLYLSLGNVKNLASVRLNGKDLGIVWCQPWRVGIPPAVLRAEDNVLEITVANLWINRLIGDSSLPEGKRLTQTTWNPFRADWPLQESGLLGPVTLCMKEKATDAGTPLESAVPSSSRR